VRLRNRNCGVGKRCSGVLADESCLLVEIFGRDWMEVERVQRVPDGHLTAIRVRHIDLLGGEEFGNRSICLGPIPIRHAERICCECITIESFAVCLYGPISDMLVQLFLQVR
jgi:hypothetical protein